MSEKLQSPEIVELKIDGEVRARINPFGAYIEQVISPEGTDLLFPKQEIDGKVRGGAHLCAPIFGPGDAVGLTQHGFARNALWEELPTDQGPAYARFRLKNPGDQEPNVAVGDSYSKCDMLLDTYIGDDEGITELFVGLMVRNNGDKTIVLTPGMHPYFHVGEDQTDIAVETDEHSTKKMLKDLDRAHIIETHNPASRDISQTIRSAGFAIPGYDVAIASTNLPTFVLWSGDPDKYVCVEPTAAGPATAQDSDPTKPLEYMVAPGQGRVYNMLITWKLRHS